MEETCRGCGKENRKDLKTLSRYEELSKILMEETKTDMSYEDLVEWTLGEMEDVFHTSDILLAKTAHYAHSFAQAQERWSASVSYGELALQPFREHYGSSTGVVAGLLLNLGEAMLK